MSFPSSISSLSEKKGGTTILCSPDVDKTNEFDFRVLEKELQKSFWTSVKLLHPSWSLWTTWCLTLNSNFPKNTFCIVQIQITNICKHAQSNLAFPVKKTNKFLYFSLFCLHVPKHFKPRSTRWPLTKEQNFIGQIGLSCLIFLLCFYCRKFLSWSYIDL